MRRPYRLASLLLVALPLLAACSPESERSPMEGAWEMISGTYTTTNPDTTWELTMPQIKILTESHFAFGRQNEFGAFAGGGRYTVDSDNYTEIIEYHSDPLAVDTTLVFDYRLEGDTLWYHSGNIGPNFHLEEVWRRVEME